jgi:hypothetical protein
MNRLGEWMRSVLLILFVPVSLVALLVALFLIMFLGAG